MNFGLASYGRGTKLDSQIMNLNLPPPSTALDTEVTSIFARGGRDLGKLCIFSTRLSHSGTDSGRAYHPPGLCWTLRYMTRVPAQGTYLGRQCLWNHFTQLLREQAWLPFIRSKKICDHIFFFLGGPETLLYSLITHLILQLTSQDLSLLAKIKSFRGFLNLRKMPWLPALKAECLISCNKHKPSHGDHCKRSADLDA